MKPVYITIEKPDREKPNVVMVAESPPFLYMGALLLRHVNVIFFATDIRKWKALRVALFRAVAVRSWVPNFIRRVVYRLLEVRPRAYFDPEDVDLVIEPGYSQPVKRVFSNAKYILWSMDSHAERIYKSHLWLVRYGYIDVVYATHSYVVKRFREDGVEAYHLPYAVPNYTVYPRPEAGFDPKPFFLGRLDERRSRILAEAAKILEKHGVKLHVWFGVFEHDYARTISRHMLAVNVTRMREVNWRSFEVPGARGLLINEDIEEMREFFEPGRHYLPWSTPQELAERIIEALDDIERVKKMAAEACIHVWRNHTVEHRLCQILEEQLGYKCREPILNQERALRACRAWSESS